jgi:hypothetical protein
MNKPPHPALMAGRLLEHLSQSAARDKMRMLVDLAVNPTAADSGAAGRGRSASDRSAGCQSFAGCRSTAFGMGMRL